MAETLGSKPDGASDHEWGYESCSDHVLQSRNGKDLGVENVAATLYP